MQLIDRLRAMQIAEREALNTPNPLYGGTTNMTDFSGGFVGAGMIEDDVMAALDGASDEELRAALETATAEHETWSTDHLAAAIKRRASAG